jgi:hypothetical protein
MISYAPSEPVSNHARIAYRIDDNHRRRVVIVEFLSDAVAVPAHAVELGQQLDSLIRPDLPSRYVLDFAGVQAISSTAFGSLLSFILKVRHAGR